MDSLAHRIEAVRTEKGLTKTDIWQGAGLSSGVYAQWMNGAALKGETLIKVASVLGVNPDWLQTGKGNRDQKTKQDREEITLGNLKIPSRARLLVDLFNKLSSDHQHFIEMSIQELYKIDNPKDKKAHPYPTPPRKLNV